MAKRTSWSRDSIGRFAGKGGAKQAKATANVRRAGARKTAVGRKLAAGKANRVQRRLTFARAEERRYVKLTGDTGGAKTQARVQRGFDKRAAKVRKAKRQAGLR